MIGRVFGASNPVHRCLNHKVRDVVAQIPDELADQVRSVMRAAFRLPRKEDTAKLRMQAECAKTQHPAARLGKGLEDVFSISRLELSPALRRCLGTTHIIDRSHSAIRTRTQRVSRW